jgi:demethylmenaquinone methyltransferase / 2-methoxy-6-polyprenyl-1,4-benzoquinol methylase
MTSISGTTPPGTTDERQAAAWVQQMFAGVAPNYDLLNHLLSFNIDRRWRKALIRNLAPVLTQSDATVLDLCCGTGDVIIDLQEVSKARIIGADFCHPMLVTAHQKIAAAGSKPLVIEGDALQLPIADSSVDAISIAFGFRNLANYSAGLRELHRVLKPGGMLGILEFSHPSGWFMKTAYGLYSRVFMPTIGGLISGSRDAYSYLPESIRNFPSAPELRCMMEAADFEQTRFELLTSGIAALHTGVRSPLIAAV